jgi:hypothetical protein
LLLPVIRPFTLGPGFEANVVSTDRNGAAWARRLLMGIYVTTRAVRSIQVITGFGRRSLSDPAGLRGSASSTATCQHHPGTQWESSQQETATAASDDDGQVENLCWWAR